MIVPQYFQGKFTVAQDCKAPACEVISLREWLMNSERIIKALKEFQKVMEARIADGVAVEREASALVNVREAGNLLRSATLLVCEDADAAGVKAKVSELTFLKNIEPARSGKNFYDFEVYCAHELSYLTGLFGETLQTHYLSMHPEAIPHRHWMVMQALGGAFQRLLLATADMCVANEDQNKGA